MRSLARLTFIVALAILVGGCGTGATTAPSAPSAALASPGAVSALPTASPTPPSASASETAAASSDTLTDVDDGATAGDTGPLPSIAASIDPTASATGWLSAMPPAGGPEW